MQRDACEGVEGWSAFDSPRNTAMSLIFVLLQYFGAGMIESVLTLRTGSAWVHAARAVLGLRHEELNTQADRACRPAVPMMMRAVRLQSPPHSSCPEGALIPSVEQ
jgi:hypothetical protein